MRYVMPALVLCVTLLVPTQDVDAAPLKAVTSLTVYDANGKKVGPIVVGNSIVVFRINGNLVPLEFLPNRFRSSGTLFFEAPSCVGQAYISKSSGPIVPTVVIAPPNQTVYGLDRNAPIHNMAPWSAYSESEGCSTFTNLGNPSDFGPAIPLVDLEGRFTPPFTVR